MPLLDYPLARPRISPGTDRDDILSVGLGIAAACLMGGLLLKSRTKPVPKPQPCSRVSVFDLDCGKVLVADVPYVLEERWDNHQYFFKFKNGGERFLDLRGTNYRIVRREA